MIPRSTDPVRLFQPDYFPVSKCPSLTMSPVWLCFESAYISLVWLAAFSLDFVFSLTFFQSNYLCRSLNFCVPVWLLHPSLVFVSQSDFVSQPNFCFRSDFGVPVWLLSQFYFLISVWFIPAEPWTGLWGGWERRKRPPLWLRTSLRAEHEVQN